MCVCFLKLETGRPRPPSHELLPSEALGLRPLSEWQVLSLASAPGLLLLPDLFRVGCQHYWIRRCLVDYPCRPNLCNLDAHMEREGQGCLWPGQDQDPMTMVSLELGSSSSSSSCEPPTAKRSKLAMGKAEETTTSTTTTTTTTTTAVRPVSKDSALYRLRWVTLGYHYDWNKKAYNSKNRSSFPEDLATLSSFILHCVGFSGYISNTMHHISPSLSTVPCFRFKAEAAIVNYYHLDSSLSGHTDHSEKDLARPLLSIR